MCDRGAIRHSIVVSNSIGPGVAFFVNVEGNLRLTLLDMNSPILGSNAVPSRILNRHHLNRIKRLSMSDIYQITITTTSKETFTGMMKRSQPEIVNDVRGTGDRHG